MQSAAPQTPASLDALKLEERRLADRLEEDTRRAASTRRILFVVILLIAACAVLLFRDLNLSGAGIPALIVLAVLSSITVILLAVHKTGVHATLYRLHILQRTIRDRETPSRTAGGEDRGTGGREAPGGFYSGTD
jgi:fatty acid desaturase